MVLKTILNVVSTWMKPTKYQVNSESGFHGVLGIGSRNQIETREELAILHGALIMGDWERAKEARGKLDILSKTKSRVLL